MNTIQISPIKHNHRVFVGGKTGSGKSVLARAILRRQPNVVVIDTKCNEVEEWAKVGKVISGEAVHKVGSGRYIWQPQDSFLHDIAERNYHLQKLYKVGNRVIYIDEFGDIAPSAQKCPAALQTMSMRGRSAGLGLWGTTQRPHGVPLFCMSEAEHYFIFVTKLPHDRKRIENVVESHIDWDALGDCPACMSGGSNHYHPFFYKGPRGPVQGPTFLPSTEVL